MTADARAERFWWDDHSDDIYVWGEEGEANWRRGVNDHLARVSEALGLLDLLKDNWGPPVPEHRYLDVGCGPGRLTLPHAIDFPTHQWVGVDLSPAMIRRAQDAAHLTQLDNVRFWATDGRTIPEALGSFDGAWSILLYQHLPPDAQHDYVRQIAPRLKPGARLLIQTDTGTPTRSRTTTGGSFLHWRTNPDDLTTWAHDTGLDTLDTTPDNRYPQWTWHTLQKR